MATLEAVGLSTATYTGDTAVEADCDEMDGNEIDGEEAEFDTGGDEAYGDDNDRDDINDRTEGNNDNDSFSCSFPAHGKQLIDCETTGGSHYSDHIIEVAATFQTIHPSPKKNSQVFAPHLNIYPVLVSGHLGKTKM